MLFLDIVYYLNATHFQFCLCDPDIVSHIYTQIDEIMEELNEKFGKDISYYLQSINSDSLHELRFYILRKTTNNDII